MNPLQRALLYFSSFLFWFFFFLGNEFVYSCISPKDSAVTLCFTVLAFIHLIVSGATGVPWKRQAGFPC